MTKSFLGLVLLSACAPDVIQVGPAQYSIDGCHSSSACYEAAAEMCPRGFDLMDHNSSDQSLVQSYFGQTTVTPVHREGLLVQCRR